MKIRLTFEFDDVARKALTIRYGHAEEGDLPLLTREEVKAWLTRTVKYELGLIVEDYERFHEITKKGA